METDRTEKKQNRKMPVWALVTIDLLAVLVVIGGWFGARIIGDMLAEEEYIVVSEARDDLLQEQGLSVSTPEPSRPEPTAEAEVVEEEPEPDLRTPWQIRFEDHFTPEVVTTENSYSSPNISVTVSHHEVGEGDEKITYHLADIYIGNVECFRSGLAKTPPKFRMSASLLKMMEDNNAVVAVWSSRSSGVDLCVLYRDGRMQTYSSGKFHMDKAIVDDVFQVWSFGPALLNEDGTPRDIPWSAIPNVHISGRNPRTAIGYYEPGHYCFMVVDGRQKGYSRGATLAEMSQWFSEMGCMAAFNLDGGGSSLMGFQGELISKFYSEYPRNLSDCIYITDYALPTAEEAAGEDAVEAEDLEEVQIPEGAADETAPEQEVTDETP